MGVGDAHRVPVKLSTTVSAGFDDDTSVAVPYAAAQPPLITDKSVATMAVYVTAPPIAAQVPWPEIGVQEQLSLPGQSMLPVATLQSGVPVTLVPWPNARKLAAGAAETVVADAANPRNAIAATTNP